MTNRLPGKPRVVTNSMARRTALLGAAATALIAATPALHAATPEVQSATLQAAVRNALRLPVTERMSVEAVRKAFSKPSSLAAPSRKIDFNNGDNITVGPDQTAIPLSSTAESISIVNTGDLTGGIGIDVYTGAVDLDTALVNDSVNYFIDSGSVGLYDDAGNRVVDGYGNPAYIATGRIDVNRSFVILPPDPADSTITIDNRGSIAFADQHAIRAINPAGQSIDITNTGDITSTGGGELRAGIYARTEAYESSYTFGKTADGERTYNEFGQVTGVISLDEYAFEDVTLDMEYDGGAIAINNSGNIDMGLTTAPPYFGSASVWASAGIQAVGDGGTTIVNSGDIKVDKWSAGIEVRSTATTSISNSGRIDIGNSSAGISFSPSAMGDAGDYRLGGDVYIVNSGEIRGGITKDEVTPGELATANGIYVVSLGSNNENLAPYAHLNEVFSRYNEILGSDQYALIDIPKTRLYDTTVVNRGDIELKDGGRGISVIPRAGDSTAVNEGTIIVGDGASIALANFTIRSAGIYQNNFGVQGAGSTASINTATGIIIAGDDSAGIVNLNIGGDAIAINEGSITIGNGISASITDYAGETYDRLFLSHGIFSTSSASNNLGVTSYALNAGEITVGDLAKGMNVSGQSQRLLDPTDPTAISVNEGIISTGDNATGMFTLGTNATSLNSGSVTVGDLDLGWFTPSPTFGEYEAAQLGFGVTSWGEALSQVVNYGEITTGNGTVGAAARMYDPGYGYAAQLLQNADGVIITGDVSIGALVAGNYSSTLVNEGRITVGNDSVGADVTAGSVVLRYGDTTATVIDGALFASNSGIIETGDNSVGLRMTGVLNDVPYSGEVLVLDPPGCSYFNPPCYFSYETIEGTADAVGVSYLANSGTIRTGADSTAVVITGAGAAELGGAQIFNTGTIQAGADSTGTAIRINADNDLDSYVVNVGEIGGSIVFGGGNDTLINTQLLNDSGQVTSTGNITLNGSTIDFGAGSNRFEVDRGVLTLAGGDNLVTGADVFMTLATVDARNGVAGSTLTFDRNLSGSFTFGADLASGGEADRLIVGGDMTSGSTLGVVLNPVEQLKGDIDFTIVSVGGDNDANAPTIAGVSGQFADSLLSAEVRTDSATGDVLVSATFGMGHMAIAAGSATTMAQNWWLQSVETYDKRNMHRLSGASETGWSAWGSVFHEEGTIDPDNSLQDVSFDQKVSALQAGVQWTGEVGGGRLSAGPIFGYGDARANSNANIGSAKGNVNSYGLNASYRLEQGLYFDASWQSMTMDTDFRTPGTVSGATGESDADGDGYNLEVGYEYKLQSGLALVPQLQYASVDVELDDFTSSDGVYGFTDVGGKASLLRAGVAVLKTFETENGFVTPVANLNYLYSADGESELRSNGVQFDNDSSGSGYRAEFGIAGRYKAWDITGRVGVADMSSSDYMLSTNIAVRYRW